LGSLKTQRFFVLTQALVSEGARDERERRALRAVLRRTGFRRDRFRGGLESVEIQALEKRIRSVSRREFYFVTWKPFVVLSMRHCLWEFLFLRPVCCLLLPSHCVCFRKQICEVVLFVVASNSHTSKPPRKVLFWLLLMCVSIPVELFPGL
jgi:hypothetical protein